MSNFEYFNPNPKATKQVKHWDRCDCTVRAISKATGMSWKDTYLSVCKSSLKVYDMPNSKIGEEQALKDLGFTKGESLKPVKGGKWPLVN